MPDSSLNVIITCAINGAIHTPTMSPYLPITPAQMAESAIGAAKAGAAIVHLHARDPRDGRPVQDPELFKQFLPPIRAACDVIVNITTGGSQTMTVDERMQPALQLKPELASLNMGTMNFGLYEMLPRQKSWQHEWEPAYLAGSEAGMFKNTLKDISDILRLCSPNGKVYALGSAQHHGDMSTVSLAGGIVAMASTATGNGYWLVGSDGGIFSFGDAQFYGSTGNIHLNKPVVGMAATPTGKGYWMVAEDGGVFAYGDARFCGSTGDLRLAQPVISMVATPSGNGYWFVASDGGVFAFGDAQFKGAMAGTGAEVVGMGA